MAARPEPSVWSRMRAFSDLAPETLAAIAGSAAPMRIPRGMALMRQGEAADALYLVVSGRFHVFRNRVKVAEIGAGEPVGELAFFPEGRAPRPSWRRVTARRCGSRARAYDALARRAPHVPQAILASVSRRLAAIRDVAPVRIPAKVIAVCPSGAAPLPPGWVGDLAAALGRFGSVAALGPADLPAGLAQADEAALVRWLHAREAASDFVLHALDGPDAPAARAALRNSDALLLVGRLADGPAAPGALEAYGLGLFAPEDRVLALWRERAGEPIRGSGAWLDARPVGLHHHVAKDAPADMERLARFLAGAALGAVFCGGGAFGAAHVGVMRALLEAGVKIDMFGGTSSGAAMAAAFEMGLHADEVMARTETAFVRNRALRLTIPVYSLVDHRAFDAQVRTQFGTGDMEDLPRPCFTVSTSLSANAMCLHRRGPIWQAVRASGAIPGVLPPFVTREGEVLVDGALLDNLPVRAMRALKAGPNVVVTFAETGNGPEAGDYESLPSRLGLARDLLLRRRRAFPRILDVLVRSMLVASRRAQQEAEFEGDILLAVPPLPGMGILDWRRAREQADLAYAASRSRIEAAGGISVLLSGNAGGRGAGEPPEAPPGGFRTGPFDL